MSKDIKLNLKEFKHVSSDDKSTTLQHKQGHQLTLAHSALSKDAQAQLQALAGAPKPKTEEPQEQQAQEPQEPRAQYAEGDVVSQSDIPVEEVPQAYQGPQWMQDSRAALGVKPGENVFSSLAARAKPAINAALPEGIVPADQMRKTASAVAQATQEPADQGLAAPSALGASQEAAAMQDQQATNPMDLMSSGYNDVQRGMKQQAAAQIQAADNVLKQREEQAAAQQEALNTYQTSRQALDTERQALMTDINNGQVDPEKYWDNHSKVAAGIGMIIAGFNPTNSPNAAINFLKQQMDNNLKAQEKNLDSKHNLLAANLKQFGNLQDATTMTRIMQNDMLVNQLEMAAGKAQNPMIQAQLLQNAGKLKMEFAPMVDKLAKTQATRGLMAQANQDPKKIPAYLAGLAQTDPEKFKEMSPRYVPEVGFANTKEDAQYLKETQDRKLMIDSNVAKAIKMVKAKGTYEALGPHNAILDGLADQVATDMAKLQDPNSVARPAEVELVKKSLIESGLSTRNKTAVDTLKAFNKSVEDRYSKAFTTRGMTPPKSAGNSGIEEGARGTFQGKPVIRQNGKWVPLKQ